MKNLKFIAMLFAISGLMFSTACKKNEINDLKDEIDQLENDINDLNDDLTDLNNTNQDLTDENQDLLDSLNNHHVTTKLASDWVSSADWGSAQTVTLTFVEGGTSYTFAPSTLTFTAGQPYILQIINPVGNVEKHYFATDGGPDFFTAIATRKVQTEDAEYKAPFFEAIELLVPTTSDRMVEIYFVAVKTGSYHFICTIGGHQAGGMEGTITITGDNSLQLDLETDSGFNTELARDGRKSGGNAVWQAGNRVDETITFRELGGGVYAFDPDPLNLTKDVGYKLSLVNPAFNESKHYYTASEFYKTVVIRKCQDSHGEIKPYYLKAVELRTNDNGTQTDLYVVPTKVGAYQVICTVGDHQANGMDGFINVN